MARLREFRRDDIPDVASLWQRIFRAQQTVATASLEEYFGRVFFDSPWFDEQLPSWVYLGANGRIAGFLGVLPRRMVFDGQPIRAAVATQLMVDPHASAGIAAIELIKKYFAGPQDLAWTDGANASAQKLWVRLGGENRLPIQPGLAAGVAPGPAGGSAASPTPVAADSDAGSGADLPSVRRGG